LVIIIKIVATIVFQLGLKIRNAAPVQTAINNKNKVIMENIQQAMEYCTVHNSTDDATFAAQKKI
jgi:hypothetical protein